MRQRKREGGEGGDWHTHIRAHVRMRVVATSGVADRVYRVAESTHAAACDSVYRWHVTACSQDCAHALDVCEAPVLCCAARAISLGNTSFNCGCSVLLHSWAINQNTNPNPNYTPRYWLTTRCGTDWLHAVVLTDYTLWYWLTTHCGTGWLHTGLQLH